MGKERETQFFLNSPAIAQVAGLEGQISIVKFSELENIALRLDPEYYYPIYLKYNLKLLKIGCKKLGDIAFVTDGIHESIKFDETSNIKVISAKAPKENFFDTSGLKNISKEQNAKNPRTQLVENDIILSSVGTIGNCAVVNKEILPATADRHVGIIRLQNSDFKPRFISTFLLSKYGRFQSLRESTGNVQLNLFVYKINELLIPYFSIKFQELIENICLQADMKKGQGIIYYNNAQNIVLSELKLNSYKPQHQLSYVKNYSDTQQAKRFDAEYFQPKYDGVTAHIQNYSHGWGTVGDLAIIKDFNATPKHNQVYTYIELSNIGGNGEITGAMSAEGKSLPSRARRRVSLGDVIVSSIEGSLSSIALVNEEYNESLCSTGFYVIQSKVLNSETLLVLLKSIVGQSQLKKGCSGTILTAINKEEFSKIILPKLNEATQSRIQHQVQESFALRNLSKHLLESAKQAVEIAIEQNETEAIRYLEKI